ncbi:hypothetical protein J6590_041087 [Homalodisca vitripennis]|nr:hypothetical protein J6590_041087 [Homalodisca vitripennis]
MHGKNETSTQLLGKNGASPDLSIVSSVSFIVCQYWRKLQLVRRGYVIPVEQNIIRDWTKFLKDRYKPKCPFKNCPIREASVDKEDNMFQYRNSFNGVWTTANLNRYPNEIHDIDHQFQPQGEN